MFLTLFVVLLVMWMLGFFAFHVAGGRIHLLLIIAVISLVMHLFRKSHRRREHPSVRFFSRCVYRP